MHSGAPSPQPSRSRASNSENVVRVQPSATMGHSPRGQSSRINQTSQTTGPLTKQPSRRVSPEPMKFPDTTLRCAPGLEYLEQLDHILIHQQINIVEMMTTFQTRNKYEVKNSLGQLVYLAHEQTEDCHREMCGRNRGFLINICDYSGYEVIRVVCNFKLCACCWGSCAYSGCCQREVVVEAPPGVIIGKVKHKGNCVKHELFDIIDVNGLCVLEIRGPPFPCCTGCRPVELDFNVLGLGGEASGKITREWTGFLPEWLTGADKLSVSFPMSLGVNMKAVMLGALFLIDFMFFQYKERIR